MSNQFSLVGFPKSVSPMPLCSHLPSMCWAHQCVHPHGLFLNCVPFGRSLIPQ